MDQGNNVQDENLVNDQVTQAIADSGVADAPAADDAAATPTVPTEPVVPAPEPAAEATPGAGVAEATPVNAETVSAPVGETPVDDTPAQEDEDPTPATPVGPDLPNLSGSDGDDDLMGVKQAALEQLSPLVDHLDLPPEQKFDTYMEILRASDDRALVQPAFDEAQKIEDEDKKAQALLDVVNEVNYLTQDHDAPAA